MLSDLAREIKDKARELGFDLCGIAPAEPSSFKAEFREWLANGYHGEMDYMARGPERRLDPQLVLPGAKSIVVVAMNYYTESEADTNDPERAVFARYARGDDYHDVMTPRLQELLAFIKEKRPFVSGSSESTADDEHDDEDDHDSSRSTEGRVYVDTGPLLEREIAQRAGLGWFGKNTMLINSKRGSYFLLGEIILNLPLPPDSPAEGSCGTCTRCLDACPTEAFAAPYVLDSRRCISYLTIELKGPIPEKFHGKIGNRIFGCDICQDVCPFNERRASVTDEPAFQARAVTFSKLSELAEMSEEEFRAAFKGSPVKRAKRRGLMRNVGADMSALSGGFAEEALE